MPVNPSGASIAAVTHHRVTVNDTDLHYVSAGSDGSPILLVHGFPESWWAFHKLIPLLAATHRVFAVDLRGFGDSAIAEDADDSAVAAEDLHSLIAALDVGPVHVAGQDISGGAAFRLASAHPEDLLSVTAIEMGLAGFGLESLADVTRGGSWHIGVLAAPGIPDLLLVGRETELLAALFGSMVAVDGALDDGDIAEFARTYSRPGGWRGAAGLYRAMLNEGDTIRQLANNTPLTMPVLAVGAGGGAFTSATMEQVVAGRLDAVSLEGVGHYAALEAPDALADEILGFAASVDGA